MRKLLYGIPKRRAITDLILSIIWALFNCYFITVLSELTGAVLNGSGSIPKLAIFFFIYIFLWEAVEFVADVHQEISIVTIENNVQSNYFNQIYHIKPSILKSNNTGYISGLLTKLVGYQTAAYSQIILFVPLSIAYIIYFVWQMRQYHFLFGFSLFALIFIATIFRIIGNIIMSPKIQSLSIAEANRNKLIVDTVTNIGTVQKMQASNFINEKMENEVKNCTKKTLSYSLLNEIFFCGFKLLIYIYVPVCLCIYYFVLKQNIDNPNEFFSLLGIVSIQIVHVSKHIALSFAKYAKFKGSRDKLDEIVNSSNTRHEIEQEKFQCAALKDIDYSYEQGGESRSMIHIKIPDFHINKNDIVCVHGESGQGKTTLLHLLSGEIENDGVFVNGHKTDKRIECVFIAQDTEILDMNIRDNLTLGNKNISDDELIDYLELVGLRDWFDAQKDGLDTILGERGVFVSTGQRQRLNLIRGLLIKDKEIYLLDEPTSNVDDATEDIMIDLIQKALNGKTAIIVTHKPKIKQICNRSYKFENGVLSEETK